MVERKKIGGANAYVEDRSAIDRAARDVLDGKKGAHKALDKAVRQVVQGGAKGRQKR